MEKLDELIADPDTSDDGERETLQQHKVIAESLLKTIKDALAELNKPVTDSDTPQTGDNTNLWLWVVLLFASSTGIFGITLYDRKRRTASKK